MHSTVGVNSVLSILHDQHVRTRELLHHVADRSGPDRRQAFDALRRLLAVHEAAEDFVLRPAARTLVPRSIVLARIDEERAVTVLLERIEQLDLDSRAFRDGLLAFTEAQVMHMWFEEAQEWLPLETRWNEDQQLILGAWLRRAFALDPTGAEPGGAIAGAGERPGLTYSVLFQEAVDRLAETRPRGDSPGYFEITTNEALPARAA